jgi:hypothetical protein
MTDNYDLIVDTFNRTKEKQINYLLKSFTSEGMINDFLSRVDSDYDSNFGYNRTEESKRYEKMYDETEQAMYTELEIKPEPISVEKVVYLEKPMAKMMFSFTFHISGNDYKGEFFVIYDYDDSDLCIEDMTIDKLAVLTKWYTLKYKTDDGESGSYDFDVAVKELNPDLGWVEYDHDPYAIAIVVPGHIEYLRTEKKITGNIDAELYDWTGKYIYGEIFIDNNDPFDDEEDLDN